MRLLRARAHFPEDCSFLVCYNSSMFEKLTGGCTRINLLLQYHLAVWSYTNIKLNRDAYSSSSVLYAVASRCLLLLMRVIHHLSALLSSTS